jgi:glycosyltransferase involved in cell wall biosynthesis
MDAFAYGVVIPTHNRRDLVLQAVESVWAQTWPPDEVVVVIDGDVDGTEDALRDAYPRTCVVTLDGNTGAAGARNVGLARITTPWVAFLDDDDLWHHEKQETLRRYVEAHPDCRAVRPEFWLFHTPGEDPGGAFGLVPELAGSTRAQLEAAADEATPRNDLSYLDIEGRSLPLMLERNRGVISGSVVRRDVLDQLPPVPDGLRRGQDWLLFINVAAVTEWHLVTERLVFIRLHGGQITRTRRSKGPEYVTALLEEVWTRYGDRPGIDLDAYGHEYRTLLQGWVWSRLRGGDVRGAVSAYRGARRFVPRTRDRAVVWTPPQVTWRVERLRQRFRHRTAR